MVIGVRAAQAGWQIAHRDPIVQGWPQCLGGPLVFGFGVVGAVLLRISRRRNPTRSVSELGDELGRVGFAVAAALLVVSVPVQVFLAVVQVLASLAPHGANSTLCL